MREGQTDIEEKMEEDLVALEMEEDVNELEMEESKKDNGDLVPLSAFSSNIVVSETELEADEVDRLFPKVTPTICD